MQVIYTGTHPEMCSGESNSYKIVFDAINPTVKDVLQEIKEYTNKDSMFQYLADGYGCKDNRCCGCWGIYIDNKIFISGWAGEDRKNPNTWKDFYEGNQQEEVISCYGDGGWYCGINFYITTGGDARRSGEGLQHP